SSPTAPVMPLSTVSAGTRAASTAASGPVIRRGRRYSPADQPRRCASAYRASWTSWAAVAFATATTWTSNSTAWDASRAGSEPPAASATTSKRPGWARTTSSACVPIEPVEPSTTTRVTAGLPSRRRGTGRKDAPPAGADTCGHCGTGGRTRSGQRAAVQQGREHVAEGALHPLAVVPVVVQGRRRRIDAPRAQHDVEAVLLITGADHGRVLGDDDVGVVDRLGLQAHDRQHAGDPDPAVRDAQRH